ncbi:MAG: glycosyltransferase [Clostridium sp.]|nr:glycosyltransferase [Clostridium sp.]
MLIDIALYYVGGRGGVEAVTTKVSEGLKKKGHRVRVIMAYAPPHIKWIDSLGEVYYYGNGIENSSYEYLGKGYRQLMDKIGLPDVCIAAHIPFQSYICNLGITSASIDKKIPILSWLHGDINIYRDPYLISYAKAHLAISSTVSDGIKEYDNKKNIYLVNNPINIKKDNIIKRPQDDIFKILSIGRLEEEKNLFMLMHALNKINGKWKATIIGDGSKKEVLENVAKILRIDKNISWSGWKEEPWKGIDEASICISTSNTEGFSMVLAEALARGIPVISTRCGGPSDIVEDGVNGWLVNKNDYFKVAEIINDIIYKKIELPLQQVCISSVEKFSEDKVIENIENAIINELKY